MIDDVFSAPPDTDVWQTLRESKTPVVMYGTGNGADKVLEAFSYYGIECQGFFASDGFVRKRSFHGKEVLSYGEALARFGKDMTVVVGFASNRSAVVERIVSLSRCHTLYMPCVPVIGSLREENGKGGLFTLDYFQRHIEQMRTVSSFFLDEISKKCYNNIIAYRLSGDISYLMDSYQPISENYRLLGSESWHCCVDLGAYTGDTLSETVQYAPSVSCAICAEPDSRTFRKLRERADALGLPCAELHQAAAWYQKEMLSFASKASRGSSHDQKGKTVAVQADTPDAMIGDRHVDYIKYDVEGAEENALLGSQATISRCQPAIALSLYHRTEDIFTLPLLLRKLCPSYRFYLRRAYSLPDWEIALLAK